MRGTPRDWFGIGAGVAGIVAMAFALNDMLNTGSCASGGPYVSVRACPDDEIWWILLLSLGTVAWIVGIISSRTGLAEWGTGQALWVGGFVGVGLAVLAKAIVQDSMPPDARLGAYIVGGVFIPIGISFLFAARFMPSGGGRRIPKPRPDTALGLLHRLRSLGELTRAEYKQIKADIDSPGAAALVSELQSLVDGRDAGRISQREFNERKRALL
jgi:hypothetical protein